MILDQLDSLETLLGRAGRDRLLALGVLHGEEGRIALARAFASGNTAQVRAQAHRLRGAVAPFGAAALVALLLRVETAGDVPAGEIDEALAALVEACRRALGQAARG